MFNRIVLMVLDFVLVFDDLAIEFVDQGVDGSIEIMCQTFYVDVFAAEVQINVGLVTFFLFPELINCQDDCDINDLIEMSPNPL